MLGGALLLLLATAARAEAMPFSGPAADSEKLALVRSGGMLRVLDAVVLANPHGSAIRQVVLPLPAGAQDVSLQSGGNGRAHVAGDTLVVPLVLAPKGHAALTYAYAIPAPRLPVRLVRRVGYPTAELDVLMRADQASLAPGVLAPLGTTLLDGVKVSQYGEAAVPPGTVLALTIESPPTWLARAAAVFTPVVWMIVGAAALAVILLLGLRREGMLPWPAVRSEAPR